jgi:hypothetical protein
LDDGFNEFSARPLGTGVAPPPAVEEHPIFPVLQSMVKAQKSRGFQDDCRTDQPTRANEKSTKTGHKAIRSAKIRRPLPRTIEDEQLFFDENGLGDHRTDAARTQKPRKRGDHMDEKGDKIAHLGIVARKPNRGHLRTNPQFAMDRFKTMLKMTAYNLTNRLNRADPDISVTSSTFGTALRQATGMSGRQDIMHNGARQPCKIAPPENDPKSPREAGYRIPRCIADLVAARPVDLAIIEGIETIAGAELPREGLTRFISLTPLRDTLTAIAAGPGRRTGPANPVYFSPRAFDMSCCSFSLNREQNGMRSPFFATGPSAANSR